MTWAPWSKAATSKAERVRVEVFSKISAISLPSRRFTSVPEYLAIFRASESCKRKRSSFGSKSISFRKLRLRRLYIDVVPFPYTAARYGGGGGSDPPGTGWIRNGRSPSTRRRVVPAHPGHAGDRETDTRRLR